MMMGSWPKVKLADCVDLLAGFPFKSNRFTDNPGDVPLVKGENVSQGRILWDISKRWPVSDWEIMQKFHLVPGDVVVAMDRPWIPAGLKWSVIREGDPKALLVQRCARLRSKKECLNQIFLRFVIGGPEFEGYVKPITTGVNVPHISGNQILDFEFTLPPLPIQHRIAGILSAYDDLIENSQRRIKILEEMARRLYREWFVYFHFPGHEGCRFVESPLGDIPEGWEILEFRHLFAIKYGKTLPKTEISDSGLYPVYGAGDVIGFYDKMLCPNKCALVTSRGNGSGTVWRTREPAFVTNNSLIMSPQEEHSHWDYSFIELLLKHANVMEARTGSAQPQITIENLNYVKVIAPIKPLVEKFCAIVTPTYEQVDLLYRHIQNLRRTRDLLLTRLLSGQIDVEALPDPSATANSLPESDESLS